MKTPRKMLLITALCLLLPFVGYAKELPVASPEEVGMSPERLARVTPVVQALVDSEKLAGASVVVARKGRIVFSETFGMMNRETETPVGRDTIFRIYSMSKPITSVAAMMLYDEGKLKLDAPVSTYIPEFKGLKVYADSGVHEDQVRPVTVRDLLRHTAGLTYGYFGNTPVDKMYRAVSILDRDSSLRDMIGKLAEIPLLYQPGTRWHYSVSVDVLGYLVQTVSGQPLDVFFQERIFAPLDMRDTAFYVPGGKVDRFAVCYGPKADGGLRIVDDPQTSEYLKKPAFFSGGGGLVSTARDYLRFGQMLLNKGQLDGQRLLRPGTVEMMTANQLPDGVYRDNDGGFGLGFSVRLEDGELPAGEYGWGGMASTHFWISPKDDLVVVALSQCIPYSSQLENAVKPIVYEAIGDSKALSEVPAGAEDRLGDMVTIPAGSFLMGSNGHEGFEVPEELPQHSVYLPTYQIGKYEVTRGQYRRFIEAGGYEDPDYWSPEGWKWKQSDVVVYAGMYGKFSQAVRPNRNQPRNEPEHWAAEQEWIGHGYDHPRFVQTDDYPVVGVTYYEAQAYCKWAGGRLPTEAEWEKAARWDEKNQRANIWPWGDTWDPEKCNNPEDHNPAGGGYRTNQSAPVGSYPDGASPYGCMDMVGNAYEWVADSARSYPGNPNPFIHEGCHFVRGGCWDDGPANVRCAYRGWYLPAGSGGVGPGDSDYIGFRVAR